MASTLGDLLSEVMDDLDRPDLDPQIRRAVAAAVRRYQPERLAFNERIITFQTMPGVDVYGRGDAAAIPDLYAIDSVVMLDGNQSYPLGRIPEAWIEAADSPTSASRPCSYSYFDGSLRLWPIPSDAWTIRIAAHLRLDVPTDDAAPSPWFDEARDLISARTKWHLALHVLRDPALKAAMDVAAADAFTTLKGRANGIASSGRIEAYDL